jgi:hypothetical protein
MSDHVFEVEVKWHPSGGNQKTNTIEIEYNSINCDKERARSIINEKYKSKLANNAVIDGVNSVKLKK